MEDLREGIRYVRTQRWLWLAMVAASYELEATDPDAEIYE